VGGWGHLLGDQGSAYDLGISVLRGIIWELDHGGTWSALGQRILAFLNLNEPDDLIPWTRNASKAAVASLAPHVSAAAEAGDKLARSLIDRAAKDLVATGVACARKLARVKSPVWFFLAGGALRQTPVFRRVRTGLRRAWPRSTVFEIQASPAAGAVALARVTFETTGSISSLPSSARRAEDAIIPTAARPSPTEERNPRSMQLDRWSLGTGIESMIAEDERLPTALRAERPAIERAIRRIVRALRQKGRLFYVGAGTSGRLGILDASECPPTFRTPPDMIQGIIAGGARAVFEAVEGAEDDLPAGARAIQGRGVRSRDVVVGIAASGRTPFVWGALGEARRRGASTILVCFHPYLRFRRGHRPDVVIAPQIGPEILTGSTRLKAGTATKMILNMFTTLTMVQLGKVMGNLMVDLNPSNTKLRERAVRITRALTDASETEAREALESSDWVVTLAVKRLQKLG
jgi:N-acetylmuramic acid 6-phosphate etherase